jgi:hypothetical protein
MIRLDDNELNIHPAVAAALGHFRPEFVDGQVGSRIRLEPSDVAENPFVGFMERAEVFGRILLWIFGIVVIVTVAVLVFSILAWLYVLFTTTPQQRELGPSRTLGAATVAYPQPHRPPRPARPRHRGYRTGTNLRLVAQRRTTRPTSAYLPPAYDYACIPKEYLLPIRLQDRMPHGLGTEGQRTYIPRGTCLLFERKNVNGWRRVASYDGRLVGYAQIFPYPYQRRPMYPLFAKLIPLIRGIP